MAYFIEIRDTDLKLVMKMTEGSFEMGKYDGEYEPFSDIKNNIWMDWTPSTQMQIMKGNPNTDAQFFSGDLTVKGSIKLATKPRQWIYDFYLFIDSRSRLNLQGVKPFFYFLLNISYSRSDITCKVYPDYL